MGSKSTGGADTAPEVRAILDARWRAMPVADKARVVDQLTSARTALDLAAIDARRPDMPTGGLRHQLAAARYGDALACEAYGGHPACIGPLQIAAVMASVMDTLDIAYTVGGSLASSLVAEPRRAADVDLAVRLGAGDLDRMASAVRGTFQLLDEVSTAGPGQKLRLLHHDAAFKVDLFVLGADPLDVRQIDRRFAVSLPTEPPATVWVTSPEDQVLRKLDSFGLGGMRDQQWRDGVAILRICADTLEDDYLDATARLMGLDDLLREARADATRR